MTTIAALLARLLTGPLIDAVLKTIDAARARQLSEAELRAELQQAITASITEVATTELAARRDVLLAELRGESPLQRLWRPVVALTAFFSYWFVIVAYPFLHAWGILPQVRFGETGLNNLFWLVIVATGGYIGGRTLEKVAVQLRKQGA